MVSYLEMPHKAARLIQEALRACHVHSPAPGAPGYSSEKKSVFPLMELMSVRVGEDKQ